MTRTRLMAVVAGASLAVTMTAACDRDRSDSAADTAGRAADRAGNAAGAAAKAAGNAARDAAGSVKDAVANGGRAADAAVETMDVKAALAADSRVDAGDINVDTDHVTRTVTLRGKVPTADQKALAEQIAQQRATGYAVRNLLAVSR